DDPRRRRTAPPVGEATAGLNCAGPARLLRLAAGLIRMAIAKLTTGIPGFDILAHGGIPEGRATLVAGRSGTGKTIFGLQVAANFARHDIPTLVIGVEESADDLLVTGEGL